MPLGVEPAPHRDDLLAPIRQLSDNAQLLQTEPGGVIFVQVGLYGLAALGIVAKADENGQRGGLLQAVLHHPLAQGALAGPGRGLHHHAVMLVQRLPQVDLDQFHHLLHHSGMLCLGVPHLSPRYSLLFSAFFHDGSVDVQVCKRDALLSVGKGNPTDLGLLQQRVEVGRAQIIGMIRSKHHAGFTYHCHPSWSKALPQAWSLMVVSPPICPDARGRSWSMQPHRHNPYAVETPAQRRDAPTHWKSLVGITNLTGMEHFFSVSQNGAHTRVSLPYGQHIQTHCFPDTYGLALAPAGT